MKINISHATVYSSAYLAVIVLLTIYSYSQIDLNLTLFTFPFYQVFQKQLIQLGYFSRNLSGSFFVILFIALWLLYMRTLFLIRTKVFNPKYLMVLISMTVLFVFAYPGFSHDLFNYIFDARIVTKYGLSPWHFRALDFPFDSWTRFMHWTHRYYPYGPVWLILTTIPSFLGFQKFALTFFLFKGFFMFFHLGNCLLIYKLSQKEKYQDAFFNIALYALNPLILIDGLVSPHNEIVMLFFVLLSFYFLSTKKFIRTSFALIFSIGIKFLSFILIPLFLVNQQIRYTIAYIFWIIALIPLIIVREPYSWYLIPLVGIASITQSKVIRISMIVFSISFLARYIPFLYIGDYTKNLYTLQNNLSFVSGIICFVVLILPKKKLM